MIELTIFPPNLNCRSPSPFSMKAELLLKMAKLDYKIVHGGDPSKMPNGKFPVLQDGQKTIADSHYIYKHMCEKYNVDLDAELSDGQKAIALAFTRLAEDHLYWVLVYSRWSDDDFKGVTDVFFKGIPWGIRQLIAHSVRKKAVAALYHQGISRHEKAKIYELGRQDIDAIASQLSENSYFLGNDLSSVDAIIYSILAVIYKPELDTQLKRQVALHDNLVNYMTRIEDEFDFGQPTH
ncbi:MAG: glutathione S-transferase family protein [Rhizobiales bacterium]|nr:glutathione S-transferase family protein [Hyphomicrobiales bacterium]